MENLRTRIDIIDESIQNLFLERMQVVKQVAEYKKANNLPVLDETREKEILERNIARLDDLDLVDLYEEFFKKTLEVSRKYQERIIKE